MKKTMISAWVGLGLLLCLAQAEAKDSTTCSGILLKNHASVRADGMGGAQAGMVLDEAGAQGFNPAGLSGCRDQALSLVYYRGVADDQFAALSYDTPVGADITFGSSVLLYDAGLFDWNISETETLRTIAERDILATLTTAYKTELAGQPIAFGANLKYFHSTLLDQYSAMAMAMDLGARFGLDGKTKKLFMGVAIKNLGTPLKYIDSPDSLPLYALAGIAYQAPVHSQVDMVFTADAQYDLEKVSLLCAGAELRAFKLIALRGGYKYGPNLQQATLGMGFEMENIQVDYAFGLMTELNSQHRVSVKYLFGYVKPPEKPKAAPQAAAADPLGVALPLGVLAQAENNSVSSRVDLKPTGEIEKVQAQIVGIKRIGGRIAKVTLNIGANQQIKNGCKGVITNAAHMTLAAIIIRQVEAELSLAEVIGLSQEIEMNGTVLVEKAK